MGFMFEKLEVYQRGVAFANKAITISDNAPKGNYFLADQLKRAALSISLNIAEGNGRFHKRERRNFFVIARGSCFECVPILQLSRDKQLITQQCYDELLYELEIIGKMLSAYIRNTVNNGDQLSIRALDH